MFGFFNMLGSYEDRKVDRYESENCLISTAAVTDGDSPYETAISHPSYNSGSWVIVAKYDSKEKAQTGHDEWVKTMTADPLPVMLVDVQNDCISKLLPEDSLMHIKSK